MVRWLRWHFPPDTGFEIRVMAVWGRARYLSVTEAPHNTNFHTWMGKKHFCFFQTAETGNRTPNAGVKGSGANHYPRAPAQRPRKHDMLNQSWLNAWPPPATMYNINATSCQGLVSTSPNDNKWMTCLRANNNFSVSVGCVSSKHNVRIYFKRYIYLSVGIYMYIYLYM